MAAETKSFILTYHSHHVVGSEYDRNDHVALPLDLHLITEMGFRIVSLDRIVAVAAGARDVEAENDPTFRGYVALTFDDGPAFDFEDFDHPVLGRQRGFVRLMEDFRASSPGARQPELCATSFVIASPEARRAMEDTFDAQYTFLTPGSMTDAWWAPAVATGLLSIANHSWDHLHPGLARVAHSRQVRSDFAQVTSVEDADAQIAEAARFIAARTNGRVAPYFAFPFGQYNDFLTDDYLPTRGRAIGLRAALTTDARPVEPGDVVWKLPRYSCGQHWASPDDLARILAPV
jgi:peptidoglycan/xylan/chitin deacetylase (PgdA/CDA1 family)